VFLPRYRSVPVPDGAITGRRTVRVPDPLAQSGTTELAIVDVAADGYALRLVDHAPAYDRDGMYGPPGGGDFPDNAWRYGLFCRAALETLRTEPERPVDILHLHDWHTGPAAIQRDAWLADDPVLGRAAIVMTLHNLAYHGWTGRDELGQLGLVPGGGVLPAGADGVDLIREGIVRAEVANTVSPGFAREALTPEGSFGLADALAAKGDRFVGILNGLDTHVWDPATDADLAAPFSASDLRGKAACRADLLDRVGFDPGDTGSAVLGMIGRLDPQKGFDLLHDAAPRLLAAGARLVVQGSGDPHLADGFRTLAAAEPARVALIERFDRAMARRIYAGADFFLMPSRFEPCGTGQMVSLRYGTPPVVRRTGGLADSVIDERTRPGAGTGFAFDAATPDALAEACEAAMAMRTAGGAAWDALVARGMAVDFDWSRGSAPAYAALYERAVAIRRA
jgi:starch synthase